MDLILTKPIVFIDIETTGLKITTDRIIEISILKVLPNGNKIVKRKLINPQIPIPEAVSKIHGLTDSMVKDAPTFKDVANELKQFIDSADIGGYNSNKFDIPVLIEEFLRADLTFDLNDRKLLDVQKIYHLMEPRTLSAAYQFYCQKTLENAHSSEADIQATFEVFEAQITKYPQIGNKIEDVLNFIGDDKIIDLAKRMVFENDIEVFNFGKHKGKPVLTVLKQEPQYYDWIMKGDFPRNTKEKLKEIFYRNVSLNK